MQTNETKVVPRPPPRRARQHGPSVYAKASRLLEEKAKKESRPYQTLEPLVKEDVYRGTSQRPHTGASPARSGPSSKGRSVRRDIMAPLTPKTSSTKRHAGPAAHRRNGVKQTKIHNAKAHSVGNYLIEETIGEGTFGKVKRGMHSATKETVAIKILEKSKIKTEADLTRVTREITILKKTRHKNCIRLLEVIDTPQQIFLMMEFLDGGEVFDHIVRKTRLSEPDASDLFVQILDGVEYLHNSGVIHRDLKPENLLMQRLGNGTYRIKVADFGLSNLSDGQQLLKTACGSPCYAAPEMIAGKHYDGTKSDVWSLGVVLFALLCGYLPFEDDDTSELYRKILSASYECPSFVSFQGQNLLARMLNTNPLTRLSIQAVKGHRWMQQNASAYRSETLTPCTDNLAPEHHKIVMQALLGLGFDSAAVEKSLAAKSHNNNTAAYYLIAQKMYRTGQIQPPQPDSRMLKSEQTLITSKSKPAAAQKPSLEIESTPAPDNSEGTSNAMGTTNTTWEAAQSAKAEAEASGLKVQTKQMSDSEEEETKQDSEDEAKDKNKNEDENEIENETTSARGQQVKQPRKESGLEDQKDLLLPILTATDYLANPFERPGGQDQGEVKTLATSEHHPISDEAEMAMDVVTKDITPLARPVEACTRMDLNGVTSPAASAEAATSDASKASSDNLLSPDKQLDMRRLSITADDTTDSAPIPTGTKIRTGNLSSPPASAMQVVEALGTESKKQRVAEEPEKEQTQHQESDSPANECSNDEKAVDEGEQHQLLDQARSNSKHPEDPTFSGPENGEFSDALELEQALVLPQTKDTANQLRKPGMAIMKPFGPTSIQNPFMRPERPRVGPVLPHRARFRMSSRRTSA